MNEYFTQVTNMLTKLHAKQLAAAKAKSLLPKKIRMEVIAFTPLAEAMQDANN
jgi:hypothetical protein